MSGVLTSIGAFLLMLGVLIFVHELGHFLAAKAFGVKVEKFSLGFGWPLLSFTWGETTYQIACIPLGGYVKMLGEVPGMEIPPEESARALTNKPLWQRSLVFLAGPGFNLVLIPLVVFFVLSFARTMEISTVLGMIIPGTPAHKVGLLPGDEIVEVGGRRVRYFSELVEGISPNPGKKVVLRVRRKGKLLKPMTIVPAPYTRTTRFGGKVVQGRIGITSDHYPTVIGVSQPSSPAFRAGLRSWDRITRINGRKVRRWDEIADALAGAKGPLRIGFRREERHDSPLLASSYLLPEREVVIRPPTKAGATGPVAATGWGIEPCAMFVRGVRRGTPLDRAGVKPGDKLLAIDGRRLSVMHDLRALVRKVDTAYKITILRQGKSLTKRFRLRNMTYTDPLNQRHQVTPLGVDLGAPFVKGVRVKIRNRLWYATKGSLSNTVAMAAMTVGIIKMIFSGQVPAESVGGPILIFQVASKAVEAGWRVFLTQLALISINLGFINLLPVPILDGGHLLFALIEGISRRKIPDRVREWSMIVGLALLGALLLFAFRNDVTRLLQ